MHDVDATVVIIVNRLQYQRKQKSRNCYIYDHNISPFETGAEGNSIMQPKNETKGITVSLYQSQYPTSLCMASILVLGRY